LYGLLRVILAKLFSCLYGLDEVVYKTLEIANGIGDTCSPVNLRQGGVEYRYDILHQVCSCALENQRYELFFVP
jgi:hypothetical protein